MINAVVGLQFGDEGKGKFVDYLSKSINHIIRFNGGANAGHSVQHKDVRTSFSQIPSTLYKKELYIAQGALISPKILISEMSFLKEMEINSKLYIDPRCHVVLPIHEKLNKASEKYKGKKKIGSVGRGIGACFEDKSNRHGVRLIDLVNKDSFRKRLSLLWNIRENQIKNVFNDEFDLEIEEIIEEYHQYGKILQPYFAFINELIYNVLDKKEDVLWETSQATFLDNSFGTYPYTVAYQTLVQNGFPMIGIPSSEINAIGVMKSYMIRVGNGPFPTEMNKELSEHIRIKGNEFGTVSKRARKCGWLDLNLIKHAVKLNGVKKLAITNVDVLSNLGFIDVAVSYELDNKEICTNKALLFFENVKPVYKRFKSWNEMKKTYNSFDELPTELKDYLKYIENYVGVPIGYISYGPDREQLIEVS